MMVEAWNVSGEWMQFAAYYAAIVAFMGLRLLAIYTVFRMMRAAYRGFFRESEARREHKNAVQEAWARTEIEKSEYDAAVMSGRIPPFRPGPRSVD